MCYQLANHSFRKYEKILTSTKLTIFTSKTITILLQQNIHFLHMKYT